MAPESTESSSLEHIPIPRAMCYMIKGLGWRDRSDYLGGPDVITGILIKGRQRKGLPLLFL